MGDIREYWRRAFRRTWGDTAKRDIGAVVRQGLITVIAVGVGGYYLMSREGWYDTVAGAAMTFVTWLAINGGYFLARLIFVTPRILWDDERKVSKGLESGLERQQHLSSKGPAFADPGTSLVWFYVNREKLQSLLKKMDEIDVTALKLIPVPHPSAGDYLVTKIVSMQNSLISGKVAEWYRLADQSIAIINQVLRTAHNVRDYSAMAEPLRHGVLAKDDEFDDPAHKAAYYQLQHSANILRPLAAEAIASISSKLSQIGEFPRSAIDEMIEYHRSQEQADSDRVLAGKGNSALP